MAFKRENLKAIGLNEEQIQSVVEWHREVVDGINESLKEANAKADLYDETKKKLDEYEKENWKQKYEDKDAEFVKYKNGIEAEKLANAKNTAYTALLKDLKISEKRIPSILKVTNMDELELNKDGTLKNADKLKESAKVEWADFVVVESEKGADVKNPPANNGGNTFEQMPLAEKMQYANEHPSAPEVKNWLGK